MTQRRNGTIKRAIDDIRGFYKTGRQSVEAFPDRLPAGQGQKLSKAAGLSRDMVEKARAFAAAFSNNDLKKLCHRIQKDDFRFGIQHLVRIMRLPGQQQRWRFLDRTIKNRWSCRELAAAVRKETGRQPRAGRTPRIRNREEAVQKLISCCEVWQRLHRTVCGTGKDNGDGKANRISLQSSLEEPILQCDVAVNALYKVLWRYRNG